MQVIRIATWVLIGATFISNGLSWRFARRTRRAIKELDTVNKRILRDAWRGGLEQAANIVATLAERPYDNEPAFGALLHAEAVIHGAIHDLMKDERLQ